MYDLDPRSQAPHCRGCCPAGHAGQQQLMKSPQELSHRGLSAAQGLPRSPGWCGATDQATSPFLPVQHPQRLVMPVSFPQCPSTTFAADLCVDGRHSWAAATWNCHSSVSLPLCMLCLCPLAENCVSMAGTPGQQPHRSVTLHFVPVPPLYTAKTAVSLMMPGISHIDQVILC